jgi:hypothetical protein
LGYKVKSVNANIGNDNTYVVSDIIAHTVQLV